MATTRAQALSYLGSLARRGDFTPTKPLREYKTETLTRKAETFKQQRKAGQPLNNAVARGHAGTPEHPGRKAPQHAPLPTRQAQGRATLKGIKRDIQVGDTRVRSTTSERVARKVIRQAAREGGRVVVKVHDKNGWHVLGENRGHNRGISADYLNEKLRDAGNTEKGLKEAFGGGGSSGNSGSAAAGGDSKSSDHAVIWDDVDAYQVELLDWYDEDQEMDEDDYQDALDYNDYDDDDEDY